MKYIALFVLLGCWLGLGIGQAAFIPLRNASFEDQPGFGRTPHGWYFCNFPGESPPDVHPGDFFGVDLAPQHGSTYLALVTRPSGTYESVGQLLAAPLRADSSYQLQLYLSRSPHYHTINGVTMRPDDYNQPVRLRIYGGRQMCDFYQLLAESAPIDATEWQAVSFTLRPNTEVSHLLLQAYYAQDDLAYGGHILLDRLLPIVAADSAVNILPPRLPLPALVTTASREQWLIETLGPLLNQLLRQLQPPVTAFYTDGHGVLQGIPDLYRAYYWLSQPPTQTLRIGIRADNQASYEHLRRALLLHFQDLGLPALPLRFQRLRSTRRASRWLYHPPQERVWLRW